MEIIDNENKNEKHEVLLSSNKVILKGVFAWMFYVVFGIEILIGIISILQKLLTWINS